MAFDNSLKDDVLRNADIVRVVQAYLPLVKKGKDYLAKCPFHDDNNPSMHVSPEKQIFNCFVCHTGGNAFTFVQKYDHLSFPEAVKKVADICGYIDPRLDGVKEVKVIDPRRDVLIKCLRDLTTYYQYSLNSPEGKVGLDYFNSRHLDEEIRAKFKLGYAPKDGKATCKFLESKKHSLKTIGDIGVASNRDGVYSDNNQGRVVFPICDANGDVVGYSARKIVNDDSPKYVNSSESYVFLKKKILYNYHNARQKAHVAGYVYVLEGFMDVFALYRIGIESCVALMGTALTEEHIRLLRALNVEIRLCLDGDVPGQKNTMKSASMLAKEGLSFRIVDNQNNSRDPDEILNEDGPEALKAYLENLIPHMEFVLNYYKNTSPLETVEQKTKVVEWFLPILSKIRNTLELDAYLDKLSAITGYSPESIRKMLKTSRGGSKATSFGQAMMELHPEKKALRRLFYAEREFLYQMLQNPLAVAYYEAKVSGFYDETYRLIANFLVEYAKEHEEFVPRDLLSSLENSDIPEKDQLIAQISDLYMERNHPNVCTEELLDSINQVINEEKEKIFENDTLEQSLQGKSDLDKARIISEHNRRKAKKK